MARLTTSAGPCYATWTDDGWALIEDWTARALEALAVAGDA
jgi:hypothetical protein